MTTISTSDEDYLLNTNRHEEAGEQQQLPQEVTVSSLDDLQSALLERDARIAFLEQELVETRLQLALSKSSEDRLLLELAKATKGNDTNKSSVVEEQPREISSNDVRVVPHDAEERHAPTVVPLAPPAPYDTSEGNTVRVPLGQSIASHATTDGGSGMRRIISYSRRRGAGQQHQQQQTAADLNPGSCASGLDLLAGDVSSRSALSSINNINNNATTTTTNNNTTSRVQNLNSCASGLDLLAGGGRAQNSSSSINRMLGDIGLTASEVSLKKRKSGDVAAGHRASNHRAAPRSSHRRVNTLAGHYHGNEGWGDGLAAGGGGAVAAAARFHRATQSQGSHAFVGVMPPMPTMPAAAAAAAVQQANNGIPGVAVSAPVAAVAAAARPQANINMFVGSNGGAAVPTSSQTTGLLGQQSSLFASGTQPAATVPRANLFADLINERPSFTFVPPSSGSPPAPDAASGDDRGQGEE